MLQKRNISLFFHHQANWLPALVISVVLVFSIILGFRASKNLALLIGLAVVGAIGFFILTRHIEWGLLAIFPVSFYVSQTIGTGTSVPINATIIMAAALLFVWFLRMLVLERKIDLTSARIRLPVIGFSIAATISLFAGNIQWVQQAGKGASLMAQLGSWGIYILSILLLLMIAQVVRDERWLRWLVWVFVALGLIYISSRIYPPLNRLVRQYFASGSTGSALWTWMAALAFGQFVFNTRLKRYQRLMFGVAALLTIATAWFRNREWVSGWLPPIVAIFVILWLRSWRLGLLLSLAAFGFLMIFYSNLVSQVMTESQQFSIDSRGFTLPIMTRLIENSPILGLGPANYYHYTQLYSYAGWYVKFNSHNNYIDILAQFGILGMFMFMWLVYELARLGWKLRTQVTSQFGRGYVYACLGGLAGMLVSGFLGDWLLPFVYNVGFPGFRSTIISWIFLGGLVALSQMQTPASEAVPGETVES